MKPIREILNNENSFYFKLFKNVITLKKSIFFLFLVMSTLSYAQDNNTMEINKSQSTSRGNNLPKITISEDDVDMEATASLGIGLVSPTDVSSGMDFPFGKSWEIFFTPIVFELYMNKAKGDLISLGLGFDWRNYRMTNDFRFMKNDDGKVVLGSYPEGASPKFSRVKVFSLNFPLLYEHKFNRQWGLGIGPVFNWNTYGSIKTRFKKDGDKQKLVEKQIGQKKFTIDAMFILENPIVDLYLKYCPTDVLKDNDLKFQSMSIGIYL